MTKPVACGQSQRANRSDSRRHGDDEQRRHGLKDALSCPGSCEADRYGSRGPLERLAPFIAQDLESSSHKRLNR